MKSIKGIIFTVEEIENLIEAGYFEDLQLLDDDGDYPDGNAVIIPIENITKEIVALGLQDRIEEVFYRDDYTSKYSNLEFGGKWYAKSCTGKAYFELESDAEMIDSVVLNAMVILVKENETLCSESDGNFSEFAETNGFDVKTVENVFDEHEQYLTAIYLFNNKEVELDEIANFLDVSVDEYRDEILESDSLDNGTINFCFDFVEKADPLCKSTIQITDIFEL